jgi:hypothetical protein
MYTYYRRHFRIADKHRVNVCRAHEQKLLYCEDGSVTVIGTAEEIVASKEKRQNQRRGNNKDR